MPTRLNPYLGFRGNAREAMTLYHSVLGGDLTLSTFSEMHAAESPDEADLVMHSQLIGTTGLALMGSDTPNRMPYTPGDTYSVSLSGDDEAELTGYWDKLLDGAAVLAPLEQAPWGDSFGMLKDRFGTTWLVNIAGATG